MAEQIVVRRAKPNDEAAVFEMFLGLWPDEEPRGMRRHLRQVLAGKARSTLPLTIFVAAVGKELVGFIEVGLRSHADGCDGARPVGFLEGWYVARTRRRRGVGGALVAAAERWCRRQGCREMASDTWATHRLSISAHRALGYEVVGRNVNFRKAL
jgi:aminoglycoside 6'-N-acetyltransferase I